MFFSLFKGDKERGREGVEKVSNFLSPFIKSNIDSHIQTPFVSEIGLPRHKFSLSHTDTHTHWLFSLLWLVLTPRSCKFRAYQKESNQFCFSKTYLSLHKQFLHFDHSHFTIYHLQSLKHFVLSFSHSSYLFFFFLTFSLSFFPPFPRFWNLIMMRRKG